MAPLFWIAASCLAAGCSGREHYERGVQYMESGKPDQALGELREAVRREPDNVEYQASLSEAESAAANMHFERAERFVAQRQYAEARSDLRRTLELMPDHPQAKSLLTDVEAELARPPASPGTVSSTTEVRPVTPVPQQPAPAAEPARQQKGKKAEKAPPAPPPSSASRPDAPSFPPGSFPGTVSRDHADFPKEIETLDGIIVRLKNTQKKPAQADMEVRVGRLVKRYRELYEGSRILGRGASRRPFQITILSIDPKTETVTFLLEPLTRLPPR